MSANSDPPNLLRQILTRDRRPTRRTSILPWTSLSDNVAVEEQSGKPVSPPLTHMVRKSIGVGDIGSVGDQSLDARPQLQVLHSLQTRPQDNKASRLWTSAYNGVKVAFPELVSRYEEIVLRYISRECTTTEAEGSDEDANMNAYHTSNQFPSALMERALKAWFRQQDEAASVENGRMKIVLLVRDICEKTEQAPFLWVAMCLSIQAALDAPPNLPHSIFPSVVFIFGRARWYCLLADLLSHRQTLKESQDTFLGLERALMILYRTVLHYCISVACYRGDPDELSFVDLESLKADLIDKENDLPATTEARQNELLLKQLYESADFRSWSDSSKDVKVEVEAITDEEDGENKAKKNPVRPTDDNQVALLPQMSQTNAGFNDNISGWLNDTSQISKFLNWELGENGRLLWITGAPGSGKTTILTAIVRHILRDKKIDGVEGQNIYFAFCGGRKPNPDTLASAVATLVEQIHQKQQKLKWYLDSKWESAGQENFKSPSCFPAMLEALYSMTRDEAFLPAYFVLDAADECSTDDTSEDAQDYLLNQLSSLISETTEHTSKVRWLVSIDSAAAKGRVRDDELRIDLDVGSGALQPAVKHHITSGIQELTHDSLTITDSQSNVAAEFLAKSGGNFLWLSLAFKVIQSYGTPWNILHILKDLPEGVHALYRYAANQTLQLPWEDALYCKRILQFAGLAYSPLHIGELKDIADLPLGLDLCRFIEKRCFAFLRVDDDVVYFLHPSARKFLESDGNILINPSHMHATITQGCVTFLMKSFESERKPELLSSHYATVYWMHHFSRADRLLDGCMMNHKVLKFLSRYFIMWLESLASTKYTTRTLTLLMRLEKTLMAHDGGVEGEILSLLQDAIRVLQFHQQSQSPPDLKIKNSLLFYLGGKYFSKYDGSSAIPWLVSAPDFSLHASPQLFTLKGHCDWARSCDYSPDGHFVASSSDDSTIRIWDAQTGELQNVLQNKDAWIHRVIYSSQGFMAALGDTFITIYNSSTHIPRRKLEPPCLGDDCARGKFLDIAFSHDGALLAAVTESTVCIWKFESFDLKVLKMEKLKMDSITFSGDGSCLAVTGGSSCNVTLLKIEDGVVKRLLKANSFTSNPRFSPNSRYLAAVSEPSDVIVWDLHSEDNFRIFSGHRDIVRSISFSLDGKYIASGSDDTEIRIWHLSRTEPEAVGVLQGDEAGILSVAFSPVSLHHLASTSRKGIIRLWDIDREVNSTNRSSQPTRHPTPIDFVTLSPDGMTIASGCEAGRIFIWDGETGSYQQELHSPKDKSGAPHTGRVHWLAFSPDSTKLVSAASESKFFLWDAHSGLQMRELTGHIDWVRSAVFSPDGTKIASASDDRTVRLWDIVPHEDAKRREEESKLFQGCSDYIYCVAFSHNGRYLAFGGDDSYIYVWDLLLAKTLSQAYIGKKLEPCPPTRSLTFFPDGDKVVSASNNRILKIWNCRSGQCIQTIQAKTETYRSMRFVNHLTDYLLTEMGAQPLLTSAGRPLPQPAWCSYGISPDDKSDSVWITYKDSKIVFLPKQYHPSSGGTSPAFVSRYKVIIGCESGHMLLFKFSENIIPDVQSKDIPLRGH